MLVTRRQAGLGLVELMVSTALSLLLMAGLLRVYAASTATVATHLGATRLHHELRTVATLMQRDIRRAGYWGGAEGALGSGAFPNPFGSVDLSTPGCALLRYDRDVNGTLAAGGTEQFGFVLAGGVVRTFVPGAAFDCSGQGWIDLTNREAIEVTGLAFNLTERAVQHGTSSSSLVRIRYVQITISARLRADPSVRQTLVESVRVRNDWYQTS